MVQGYDGLKKEKEGMHQELQRINRLREEKEQQILDMQDTSQLMG